MRLSLYQTISCRKATNILAPKKRSIIALFSLSLEVRAAVRACGEGQFHLASFEVTLMVAVFKGLRTHLPTSCLEGLFRNLSYPPWCAAATTNRMLPTTNRFYVQAFHSNSPVDTSKKYIPLSGDIVKKAYPKFPVACLFR